MNWLTAFTTIFDIVYLVILLWAIWRFMKSSEMNAKANQVIAKTLNETSTSNALSAKQAAQAAQDAVNLLREKLHDPV